MCFSSSVSQLCCLYVCSISTQKLQITRTPPQRTTETESHSTLAYTTLCTFTPLLFCLCFCFALFPIQGLCQFGPRSPSPARTCLTKQNMSVLRPGRCAFVSFSLAFLSLPVIFLGSTPRDCYWLRRLSIFINSSDVMAFAANPGHRQSF